MICCASHCFPIPWKNRSGLNARIVAPGIFSDTALWQLCPCQMASWRRFRSRPGTGRRQVRALMSLYFLCSKVICSIANHWFTTGFFFEVGDTSEIYVIYEYMKCLSVDDLWIWDLGRGMEASMWVFISYICLYSLFGIVFCEIL